MYKEKAGGGPEVVVVVADRMDALNGITAALIAAGRTLSINDDPRTSAVRRPSVVGLVQAARHEAKAMYEALDEFTTELDGTGDGADR